MFEHKSEKGRVEGRQMTILDTREIQAEAVFRPVVRPGFRPGDTGRRPRSNRPGGAPMRYRGTGVLMSRASHRRRPITPATTLVLALIAAGITVWLGLVAQLGGVAGDLGSRARPAGRHSGPGGGDAAAGGPPGRPRRAGRPGGGPHPRTQSARLRRTGRRPDAYRTGRLTCVVVGETRSRTTAMLDTHERLVPLTRRWATRRRRRYARRRLKHLFVVAAKER